MVEVQLIISLQEIERYVAGIYGTYLVPCTTSRECYGFYPHFNNRTRKATVTDRETSLNDHHHDHSSVYSIFHCSLMPYADKFFEIPI